MGKVEPFTPGRQVEYAEKEFARGLFSAQIFEAARGIRFGTRVTARPELHCKVGAEKYLVREMPRRASSSVSLAWIIAGVLALVAVIAGLYALNKGMRTTVRLTPFPVKAYLEDANSLRGNEYKLEGTISAQLGWSRTEGRLFSVEAGDSPGEVVPVPVLVPVEFNGVTIQKGQRFVFQVEVIDKGIIRAKAIPIKS